MPRAQLERARLACAMVAAVFEQIEQLQRNAPPRST